MSGFGVGVGCGVRGEGRELAMGEESYNGWKNYPTWCVNLWLLNDEGLYHAALEIAAEEVADAPESLNVMNGIWTVEEATRFNLADRFREWVEEMGVEVDNGQGGSESGQLVGFGSDLIGYALGQVDWEEIAVAWVEMALEVA